MEYLNLHVTEYLPMICSCAVLRCLGGVVLLSIGLVLEPLVV
jgi:hypothetical protein